MHAGLSVDASQDYKTLQSLESKVLSKDLLYAKNAEEYELRVRRWVLRNASHVAQLTMDFAFRYAISITSSVSYGRRVKDMDDKLVKDNQEIDRCELY